MVHEIGIPDAGKIQYAISVPTLCEMPSHRPISGSPIPGFKAGPLEMYVILRAIFLRAPK